MKRLLNTVCSSYLMHPASEEILAAHRGAMGQVEQTMSALWFSSHCCQTNDGLIDTGF